MRARLALDCRAATRLIAMTLQWFKSYLKVYGASPTPQKDFGVNGMCFDGVAV
jgi:hypothetical protein